VGGFLNFQKNDQSEQSPNGKKFARSGHRDSWLTKNQQFSDRIAFSVFVNREY
jgi:hypothetical protein